MKLYDVTYQSIKFALQNLSKSVGSWGFSADPAG
jgi:hypothetical protein